MKKFILLLLLSFGHFSHAQYRDDIHQFSIYQIGNISKYNLVENGVLVHDLKNLSLNHFSTVANVVVDKAYAQLDLSFFMVRLTNSSDKNDHSSLGGSYGRYLNLYNPISLGSNSDLTIGIHGFMDLSNTEINSTGDNIKEQISVFGGGLLLDFLIGDRWNIKNQFEYGKTRGAVKFGFNSRIAFRLIGEQWFTINPKFSSYNVDKDDRQVSISGSYLLFGLARNI